MCGWEARGWGWGRRAPSPWLILSLLLSAMPLGILGEETRQVSLEIVQDGMDPKQNLLHIRAVGSNSTLHYIWSTLGPPAVLVVATNTSTSLLSVNWSLLLSPEPEGGLMVLPQNSIRFSSAIIFTRLFEFDGTNTSDTSTDPPGKPYPPYSLAEFSWNNISDSLDVANLSATFQGRPTNDAAFSNGSLIFRVQAFSKSGRPLQPPRLLHTADTSQLEVSLVGAKPRGNRSLFGLEMAIVSKSPDCPAMREQHSIDDEYNPAIFQMDQLLWGTLLPGFIQWRPVAFSQKRGSRDSALPCRASPPNPTMAYLLPQSPISRAFFGPQSSMCALNLTFGAATGPGYWDQYYLSWSMILGVGTPPMDTFSPLVLGIMAVALGAPTLMLLAGGLFLMLGPKRYSEYQAIN